MICPKCGRSTAHRSHRSFRDRIISWFGFKPYRCRDCQHRFYAYRGGEASEKLRTAEERRIMQLRRKIRWRRTRGELVLYGIGSLIMVAIIYYVLHQSPSAGE
jgi:transposase-like protein